MTHSDEMPMPPDGPTPAREQLPLPRRQRQSHLEPRLRTPSSQGSGTPFAAFTDDEPAEPTATIAPDRCADRAAAFHAGAHRGRDGTDDASAPTGAATTNGRRHTDT